MFSRSFLNSSTSPLRTSMKCSKSDLCFTASRNRAWKVVSSTVQPQPRKRNDLFSYSFWISLLQEKKQHIKRHCEYTHKDTSHVQNKKVNRLTTTTIGRLWWALNENLRRCIHSTKESDLVYSYKLMSKILPLPSIPLLSIQAFTGLTLVYWLYTYMPRGHKAMRNVQYLLLFPFSGSYFLFCFTNWTKDHQVRSFHHQICSKRVWDT